MNKLSCVFKNAGLVVGSLLILFGVLEIVFRLFIPAPASLDIVSALPKNNNHEEKEVVDLALNGNEEGLHVETSSGIRLRPNVNAVIHNQVLTKGDIHIQTNSLGFRYAELAEKESKDYRILVLGDSITFADYAPYKNTYPALIEKSLMKASPDELKAKNIQVINAGIGGIDLANEFNILLERGLAIKPDVVLVGLYLNDARQSEFILVDSVPKWIQASRLFTWIYYNGMRLHKRFASSVDKKELGDDVIEKYREEFKQSHLIAMKNWKNSEAGFNLIVYASFKDWGYAWVDGFWYDIKKILSKMKVVSRKHNIKLVVVLFPNSFQVLSEVLKDEPQQKFNALMSKLNIPHLDLLPALRDKYKQDYKNVFYDHCHYRPEGNIFVAERITNFLREKVF